MKYEHTIKDTLLQFMTSMQHNVSNSNYQVITRMQTFSIYGINMVVCFFFLIANLYSYMFKY